MGPKILYGILIALGIFIVITLIRAVFFLPKKRDTKPLEDEHVDVERVAKHLSGAIQIPTVSYPENEKIDWSQFEKFHKYLEDSYPLIHKTLERENVAEASLLQREEFPISELIAGRARIPTLSLSLCSPTRMLFPLSPARRETGLTSRSADITTASLSGAEALWI